MQSGNMNIFEKMKVADDDNSLSSGDSSREGSCNKLVNKNQIFVGAIPGDAKDQELLDHFSVFGWITDIRHVKAKQGAIVNSRSSKSFAFLTFENEDSVKQALAKEHFFKKKRLEVNISKKKSIKKTSETELRRKVYVGGLHDRTDERDIEDFFGQFGLVKGCHIIYDYETKKSRGFAFIEFYKEESAHKA